jgi:hypothetical protein
LADSSEFTVERCTSELQEEWEEFLGRSANGTIFHSHRFFAYHPADRFKQHHLIFRMRNKIRGIFTGAEFETPEGLELRSHPGASYGGFAIRKKADFEDCYGLVEALVKYCKGAGFKAVHMTPTPLVYFDVPHQGIEFALDRFGFKVSRCELTQSVDVTSLAENTLDSLTDKTRNACRQAIKKGLVYEEGAPLTVENLAVFHEMLVENRKYLGVKPTHTLEELITLSHLIPDKLHLAFTTLDTKRIAGLLHFICNQQVVLLFYVCHDRSMQEYKPGAYLLGRTLNWIRSNGYKEMDFGISTVRGEPNRGLLKFKENFCTRSFLRNTYSLEL